MQAVANKVAAVENCKAAMVTSSGMAAISSVLLTLLKAGDHMLVQESLYGGTEMLMSNDLPDWGISSTRVDADKPDTWQQHLKPNTKVSCKLHLPAYCIAQLLVHCIPDSRSTIALQHCKVARGILHVLDSTAVVVSVAQQSTQVVLLAP